MIEKNVETSTFKTQLFSSVLKGEIPTRVPNASDIHACAALELAGHDIRCAQYGYSKLLESLKKVNEEYDSDILMGNVMAMPFVTKLIGSRTNVMGSDGFMQHPNVEEMKVEDYPLLIEDPLKFMWDRHIPSLYTEFQKPWPFNALALLKSYLAEHETMNRIMKASYEMSLNLNKSTLVLKTAIIRAPFDYLAGYFRSFSGSLVDIKRCPQQVLEAVEALKPIVVRAVMASTGGGPADRERNRAFLPLHMATYMRPKDFEKFYWPTFKQTVWDLYEAGFGIVIFAEENWEKLLDYFDELPPLCEILFEYGDPKMIKEKVGKKHIIQGLYPVDTLKTGTEKQVTDKAKALLDIMAPGGQYIFDINKYILRGNQVNWDNFKALIRCVKEYGRY